MKNTYNSKPKLWTIKLVILTEIVRDKGRKNARESIYAYWIISVYFIVFFLYSSVFIC